MTKYFTLLTRDSISSPWTIQFGDYDRDTVADELEDMIDSGDRRCNLKVICTDSDQSAIQERVDQLNSGR